MKDRDNLNLYQDKIGEQCIQTQQFPAPISKIYQEVAGKIVLFKELFHVGGSWEGEAISTYLPIFAHPLFIEKGNFVSILDQ